MVELIVEIGKKSLISIVIVWVSGSVFNELLDFGSDRFQNLVVISFYVYCVQALFTESASRLFHLLSIPVFTQFIHIFQKLNFTAGANSIWRLLPFLLLIIYLANFFVRNPPQLQQNQKLFLISWLTTQGFFLFISPNLEMIIGGGITLYLLALPFYFVYLEYASKAIDFRSKIEQFLCLTFIILGVGTFGLIYFGAEYKGSDNLLATRNIADTNVTMAYFILLWPFALLHVRRQKFASLYTLAIAAIFISIIIFSFSRGAVLLILPYSILTLFFSGHFFKWISLFGLIAYLYGGGVMLDFMKDQDLTYFWTLRFGEILSTNSPWEKLLATSGRNEIQATAYQLFLQSPLIGNGIGSFEILGPGFREAHSLLYTLLAEEGLSGTIYFYLIFATQFIHLLKYSVSQHLEYWAIPISFLFYIAFNHTVGSVFVIIPGRSISVNCIAPILLMCLYFYSKNLEYENQDSLRPRICFENT